jgi:hypothetical protein
MKFELDHRVKPGLMTKITNPFSDRPDVLNAARSGNPQMESFKPAMPPNIPESARGTTTGTNEVTIGQASHDILATAPDARTGAAATSPASGDAAADKLNGADPKTAAPAAPAPGASEANIAATASGALSAKALAAKKAKTPKPVAPKRRPKPADRKSTAPAPAAPATQAAPATTTAPIPAKTSGNGGQQLP